MTAILSNLILAQGSWMPIKGSSVAEVFDCVFNSVLGVALFLFVFLVGVMVLFVLRYRRKSDGVPEASRHDSSILQIIWTAILLILVAVIFFIGLRAYLDMETPPRNTYDIEVVGQKWYWEFTYPNGHTDPVLHVPLNFPVRLILNSEDVHHSFHVPALRMTKDAILGLSTETWFTATQPGVYPAFCSEYCGTDHSNMTTALVVHEAGGFADWMNGVADPYAGMTPAEAGQKVFTDRGCLACHSVDGVKLVGPSFKGIFGVTEKMRDGSEIQVDENYLKESIEDPLAKVVEGFEPTMPPYKGIITDAELDFIVEFIKSLAE
jgi:cytochrome c oxidase subunit II